MHRKDNLLIYGTEQDFRHAMDCFAQLNLPWESRFAEDWTRLRQCLEASTPDLMVVMTPGAAGMEGIYLAKRFHPDVPVFWFSNDPDFCLQSHRLECAYFSQTPMTPEKLKSAFRRCAHVGIQIGSGTTDCTIREVRL